MASMLNEDDVLNLFYLDDEVLICFIDKKIAMPMIS